MSQDNIDDDLQARAIQGWTLEKEQQEVRTMSKALLIGAVGSVLAGLVLNSVSETRSLLYPHVSIS